MKTVPLAAAQDAMLLMLQRAEQHHDGWPDIQAAWTDRLDASSQLPIFA